MSRPSERPANMAEGERETVMECVECGIIIDGEKDAFDQCEACDAVYCADCAERDLTKCDESGHSHYDDKYCPDCLTECGCCGHRSCPDGLTGDDFDVCDFCGRRHCPDCDFCGGDSYPRDVERYYHSSRI
ncbi:hypothetical protein [Bifidobacterium sp. SO1]|uniref:hypothetical protein n=1 Tax=Bifidobacterium sp. SO1 TaxID=2809029 RepID=UPI001BDD4BD1|nr:hypothetical protein [Bifidobacterium sp. SO1]MBT1161677.1 hypothetical protein [Bifidobacterium sp. SO1]